MLTLAVELDLNYSNDNFIKDHYEGQGMTLHEAAFKKNYPNILKEGRPQFYRKLKIRLDLLIKISYELNYLVFFPLKNPFRDSCLNHPKIIKKFLIFKPTPIRLDTYEIILLIKPNKNVQGWAFSATTQY